MIVQVSRKPLSPAGGRLVGGGGHVAPIKGSLRQAVSELVGHYTEHADRGGFVGIVPLGRGIVVQLYGADGRVQAWTAFRDA